MWCQECKQDVPAIAAGEAAADKVGHSPEPAVGVRARFVCARCGAKLETDHFDASVRENAELPNNIVPDPAARSVAPHESFDTWEWELDQDLYDVHRLLSGAAPKDASSPKASHVRIDPARHQCQPHYGLLPSIDGNPQPVGPTPKRKAKRRRGPPLLAWSVLSISLMVLACGGVLLGWSAIAQRKELWSLGLPIALGGQSGMLLGFLFLFERMWRDRDDANEKLDVVDSQLHELSHATSITGGPHYTAAQAFYTHMAQGAHPSLLLSDLKSQLDMLAVRITEHQN